MESKKEARQAAARKACIMLHEQGALNDHLLPNESSSDDDSELDETDAPSEHKTGTKKRLRLHPIKV